MSRLVTSHPQISVVIPTYNRAAWLEEALSSVAKQSEAPLEILLVDDGSTDETATLCKHAACDVSYLYQERQGVSAARNHGIRASHGDWIAFLDSDDLWEPRKLELQSAYVQAHPECKILQSEELWLKNGRQIFPKAHHRKHSGWIFEACIPLCIVSPSAVMIRRSVFDDVGVFDEDLPACEDYDLWLRASLHFEIVTLPDPLTIKRGGHADQLSTQWGLDRYRIRALQKLLVNERLNAKQRSLVEEDIKRRAAILAQGFARRGAIDEAHYYSSLSEGPDRIEDVDNAVDLKSISKAVFQQ